MAAVDLLPEQNNEIYKPLSYEKFYSSLTAKYKEYKLGDYSGFNLAMGTQTFGNDYNLFSLRFDTFNKGINISTLNFNNNLFKYNDDMKPGNGFKNFDSTGHSNKCINISPEYIGNGFIWNRWSVNEPLEILFIGKIIDDRLQEIQILNHNNFKGLLSDCRILFISTEGANANDKIHNYLICPRQFQKGDNFIYVSIKETVTEDVFDYRYYTFNNFNLFCDVNKSDLNMPCYKIEKIKIDDLYDEIKLYFFKWFEKSIISSFSLVIYVLNNIETNKLFTRYVTLDNIEKFEYNPGGHKPMCINETSGLLIKNNSLIGISPSGLNFSFGSPFIKFDDKHPHLLLSIGHAKIKTKHVIEEPLLSTKYEFVRTKTEELLKAIFPNKYKQHYGSSLDCRLGYHYFSYFMIYDDVNKTFKISDFFLCNDNSSKYNFSLMFATGICKKDAKIYITFGEGDYYCSIMSFSIENIIKSCKYDALHKDFNAENLNFNIIIKYVLVDDENQDTSLLYDIINIDDKLNVDSYSSRYIKLMEDYKIENKMLSRLNENIKGGNYKKIYKNLKNILI